MNLLLAEITMASSQAHVTEATDRSMVHLLNYCATHLYAVIWYKQTDMIIAIHRDASFLYKPKSLSLEVGHFFLTNKPKLVQSMMNNVAVHKVYTTIRNVILSSTKAKISALYFNAKDGVVIRNTLKEMGHPQL